MEIDDFSELIKQKRKNLGKTQYEFAELLGVSWITVWRWENNKGAPSKTIVKLWIDKIKRM